ncbi:SDR family NAD(P)-dependent oxidoreductase [Mycoplasmatota bacterium]|nr:SDR family NAD(P)-dependent oxidoreductase [Mycoplasmatota bacterium]
MRKTIIISGATSGIGFALAKEYTINDERVIALGRNSESSSNALKEIKSIKPDCDIIYLSADLSSLEEIDNVCKKILKLTENTGIDVLINNASTVPKWYLTTKQGYEMQFQVNHLSAMAITRKLMRGLIKNKGMIITTSSRSHRGATINFNDIMLSQRYNLLKAYKQSKLANVLFTYEFNRMYKNKYNVIGYAVDPGLVNTAIGEKNSSGIARILWKLRRKFGRLPEEIISTYSSLIYNEKNRQVDCYYYKDSKPIQPSKYARRVVNSRKLWDLCYKLLGDSVYE